MKNEVRDRMVREWAEKDPRLKRFLQTDSMEMLNEIYAQKHICKKVRDVMEGQRAELTLYVMSEGKKQKESSLCTDCSQMAKHCDCEGGGNLVAVRGRSYTAVDETGKININVAPWNSKKLGKLKEGFDYFVKGKIEIFDPKKDGSNTTTIIAADSADELETDLTDLKYTIEQAFKMHDDKIPQDIWLGMMAKHTEYEGQIREEYGITDVDGFIVKTDKEAKDDKGDVEKEDQAIDYGKDHGDEGE